MLGDMTKAGQDVAHIQATSALAEQQDRLVAEDDATEQVVALEPATLPSHPLRADDVTCFLPKVIG